jgi:tetratricopeptide (TPR) repeat protein
MRRRKSARTPHRKSAAPELGAWARAALLLGPPLLAAAVYLGAIHNPFVYDDVRVVVENPSLRDLSNFRFVLLFQPFRPVVNLSYALDYWFWQLEPVGYHLTNTLLHSLNTLLFFLLCVRLPNTGRGVAALAAALFAVHPLASESVGYVSARAGLLSASFFLASFLCLQGFLRDGSQAPRARLAVGLACFGFALACKEDAAVLPAALLLYDFVFLPPGDPGRRRRMRVFYLPLFVLVLAGAALRIYRFLGDEAADPGLAFAPNLLTQSGVIWLYLRLYFFPSGQSLVHEVAEVRSLAEPLALRGLVAGAALLALMGLALRLRRFEPRLAFGIVWFLLLLLPSSVIPISELASEHRTYLANAGLAVSVAAILGRAHAALRIPPRRARAVAWIGAAALLAPLAFATTARNRVWGDPVGLWADAARKAPGVFVPHFKLAEALRVRGDCHAAIPSYRQAIALVPSYLDASNDLGICLYETGEIAEARRVFEAVLARDPGYAPARKNLDVLATMRTPE